MITIRVIEGIICIIFGLLCVLSYKSQSLKWAAMRERRAKKLREIGVRSNDYQISKLELRTIQASILIGGMFFLVTGLLVLFGVIS